MPSFPDKLGTKDPPLLAYLLEEYRDIDHR
jgi:hypothetical protein